MPDTARILEKVANWNASGVNTVACSIRRLAVTAMALLSGCSAGDDSNARATSQSDKKGSLDWLAVTSDGAEIAEARRIAQRSENAEYESALALLSRPDSYIGYDELKTLSRRKDNTLVRLKGMAAASNEPAAIGAALVLCQLFDPVGRTRISQVLEQGTSEQRIRILRGIERSWSFDEEQNQAFRSFIISDERLRQDVLQQLNSDDPKVVSAAIQTCGILTIPGWHEEFLKLLSVEESASRDRIMFWLSQGPLTPDLLDAALQARDNSSGEQGMGFGTALFEAFARHEDPKLRERARQVLQRQLANTSDDGFGYRGDRLNLISTLAETSDVQDIEWLEQAYGRERGMYAEPLLKALARLEGDAGRARLINVLGDETRWLIAVQAIGELYKDTGDEELTNVLSVFGKDKNGGELSRICQSLLKIGGPSAKASVRQLMSRLDPVEQASLRRGLDSPPMNEISARIVDAGILGRDDADKAVERVQQTINTEDDTSPGLLELLSAADLMILFDAETGMLPCRHDRLVRDFAAHSRGTFRPEAVNERWLQKHAEDFEADYELQFVHGNRLYRGRLRNFGDWYDIERTVDMINQALSDGGRPERFIALSTGDQTASFVFADPARLRPIADGYDMPLSDDADAARKSGIRFEREVFERLQQTE